MWYKPVFKSKKSKKSSNKAPKQATLPPWMNFPTPPGPWQFQFNPSAFAWDPSMLQGQVQHPQQSDSENDSEVDSNDESGSEQPSTSQVGQPSMVLQVSLDKHLKMANEEPYVGEPVLDD